MSSKEVIENVETIRELRRSLLAQAEESDKIRANATVTDIVKAIKQQVVAHPSLKKYFHVVSGTGGTMPVLVKNILIAHGYRVTHFSENIYEIHYEDK